MPVFKPFGGHDYGYDKTSHAVISWAMWAGATNGTFFIDPLEAIVVLAGALYLQEHPKLWQDEDDEKHMGSGASAVRNVQAGYCMYHCFFKGRREYPVLLPSYIAIGSNLYATQAEDEHATPPVLYAHDAHYKAMFLGLGAAFLLDMVRYHKRGGKGWWVDMVLPFFAGFAMYTTQSAKEERRRPQSVS